MANTPWAMLSVGGLLVILSIMTVSVVLHALVSPPIAQKRWRALSQPGALFGEITFIQIEGSHCQAMIT